MQSQNAPLDNLVSCFWDTKMHMYTNKCVNSWNLKSITCKPTSFSKLKIIIILFKLNDFVFSQNIKPKNKTPYCNTSYILMLLFSITPSEMKLQQWTRTASPIRSWRWPQLSSLRRSGKSTNPYQNHPRLRRRLLLLRHHQLPNQRSQSHPLRSKPNLRRQLRRRLRRISSRGGGARMKSEACTTA